LAANASSRSAATTGATTTKLEAETHNVVEKNDSQMAELPTCQLLFFPQKKD
jgi:hypothetical protein